MKSRTISIIKTCFFTKKAEAVFHRLAETLPDIVFMPYEDKENLSLWTEDAFEKSLPILFICAAGIATRTIAPFVKDKFTDSPVLVMDEAARFIIPVLSGHLGGANRIAYRISEAVKAEPIITTGTDVNRKFSIDVFAKTNGFRILRRDGIKKVAAKLLGGEKISVYVEDTIRIEDNAVPEEIILVGEAGKAEVAVTGNVLSEKEIGPENGNSFLMNLVPKKYCLGMGCKKGKNFDKLKAFAAETLEQKLNADLADHVFSLASIDLKEKEPGLMELSHFLHVPFMTFSADELNGAEGEFSESAFVKETTGVSNVCERAALLSAGAGGKIIVKKIAEDGMTISVAEKIPVIHSWSENLSGVAE